MTDDAKLAILAELTAYAPIAQTPRADDLTVADVMRLQNVGRNAAGDWLAKLVKEGHLVIVPGLEPQTGRRINLYRRPECDDDVSK